MRRVNAINISTIYPIRDVDLTKELVRNSTIFSATICIKFVPAEPPIASFITARSGRNVTVGTCWQHLYKPYHILHVPYSNMIILTIIAVFAL